MSPFNWILLVWSVGTCIATLIMTSEAEKSPTYKGLLETHSHIFSPWFILLLFYIVGFLHSFFWWWLTIPKMAFEWIRWRIIFWLINRILKVVGTNQPDRVARLKKVLDRISPVKPTEKS